LCGDDSVPDSGVGEADDPAAEDEYAVDKTLSLNGVV